MFQWRRFQFFDKELVKDEGSASLQKLLINCSTSGRGRIILGDADGFLNIIERDFSNIISFQAYERSVNQLYQLKQSNFLVTIGDDEEFISPTIKIWNLERTDKGGDPLCVRVIKIQKSKTQQTQVPVTCLAVLEDLSQIAVGLCNGNVVLVTGDIVREKTSKQTVLSTENINPITGLGFRTTGKRLMLFAITSASVHTFQTNTKELTHTLLDDVIGCGVGCSVMSDEQDIIVGRKEAVYFYEADGRGPCFAFDGDKKLLGWFRGYLVVVNQDAQNPKFNSLIIYDLKNKFIAYSENTSMAITHVVSEWGLIYVFCAGGKIYQLQEKDTQTKLETLFKKNLYSVAINLAHSQNYDYGSIIDIFRRYGDHLYSKGDYDGAIAQYVRTIGKLEPSYVIRQFLDAQRIHNLTTYLQALHEKGLANADHTTLLFNCYTKLKDVKKLDEFIKRESDATFDIETAIKACRQAGYYEHALYLAKKFTHHEWYLKILLEDLKGYTQALEYIGTLDFTETEKNVKKYGKILITTVPDQTTQLLMRLCTSYAPASVTSSTDFSQSGSRQKASAEEFIHIFVGQPESLMSFLEFIVSKGLATPIVYTTLLELYLRDNVTEFTISDNNNDKRKVKRKKAFDLLLNPVTKFDDDSALVLCKQYDFRDGLLYLYEKLALYREIVQYYMDNKEYENLIKACKKYGDKDPNLWVQVLSYLATAGHHNDCQKEIREVLECIDRENILPPLIVLQLLSQTKTATLSLIKDYISRRLAQENQLIAEDAKQIKQFKEETKKMRQEIHEIKSTAKSFQSNKCSFCTNPLDLPAVHFLCMHSFHLRCLGENESECPICAPQNKKILEIKRSLEDNVSQHDSFFKQLEGSTDGFNVVSEYYGRSIFNKLSYADPKVDPRAS
eukprot:CAMPEP_0168579026 /NCGR_PEP_ID=MMETSP0413-20121227/21645_1 /TAXON_ID=136452 /ORGANISM="Filamoeba nolandi, Strain NC-AS-23-1" /LENGTH=897 /DNA_ID=CAMNT_0008612909 /DNA_START=77 /DNA_END=2766 /DNA_ORIENTATION=-